MRQKPVLEKKRNSTPPVYAFVALLVFFLLSAAVLSYPLVSEWWNNNHQKETVGAYQKTMEQLDQEDYSTYISAAHEYNKNLLFNGTILTDPFDFESERYGEVAYNDMLNYNEIMAEIEIPEIDVDLPIYHGTSEDVLSKGIGHLEGTSLPVGGVGTHCVLTGHTGLPGKKLFTDLSKLEVDDVFYVTVMKETLTYQVDNIKIILPEEISELTLDDGKDYVTLVTCTPYGINDHRLLVRGTRIFPENLTPEEAGAIENRAETRKGLSSIEIFEIVGASIAFLLFIVMLVLTISMKRQKKRQLVEQLREQIINQLKNWKLKR